MQTDDRKRFSIFQAASRLFHQKGFEQVSFSQIAEATELSIEEVYKYFGNKEDFIFYLYRITNNDWEAEVAILSEEKLANRFEEAITIKLKLIAPYKQVLRNIFSLLLNDDGLGVFSKDNNTTRAQGMAIMENLLLNSKGISLKGKSRKEMAKMLYMLHWSVLFVALHEEQDKKSLQMVKTFANWLKEMNLAKRMLLPIMLPKVGMIADILLEEEGKTSNIAKDVLDAIFNRRKLIPGSSCEKKYCDSCYSLHLPKVQYYIDRNEPIHIILPAFPAKSPNLNKVLGKLPDLGEEIALLTLQSLCDEIGRIYKPGAHVTICTDGRIFADLVQVPDADVTAYTAALKELITSLNINCIDAVNLEDLITVNNFDEGRQYVIDQYAEDTASLKEKIKTTEQYKSMFNGMHRFITEDRLYTEPGKSKSKIKEEAKDVAVGVIQRSNAWTRFLMHFYPNALRLSIHPQTPHSEKIGIKLTKAVDEWITPWHGVIVLKKNSYVLMKKQDAVQMDAALVYKNGQPDHFTLAENE